MRQVLLIAAIFWALLAAVAGAQSSTPHAHPDAGGASADRAAEQAIRQLFAAFGTAWNAHDAKAMASVFAIDGDLTGPDGTVAKGRDAVERHFATEQGGALRDSALRLTIDSVRLITASVAVVDGTSVVSGARAADGQPLPPRKGLVSAVLVQEAGRWQIAASRSMIPSPLPWAPP